MPKKASARPRPYRSPWTAGARSSGGTHQTCSPLSPSAVRLVASTRSDGQSSSSLATSAATAPTNVLTVVEHHEEPLGGQLRDESVLRRSQRLVVDSETGGDGGYHRTPVPDGCQLDETHPRGIPVGQPMAHLQTEPRLAAAWRPHQGDQPDAIDDPHQFAGIPVTASQPGQQATPTAVDRGMLAHTHCRPPESEGITER